MVSIIEAVEVMREDHPRIDVGGLYQQFRCRGGRWALITREDVRIALAGLECAARQEFPVPHPQRIVPRTPEGAWPQFQRAVTDLHTTGGLDAVEITRHLIDTGWSQVAEADVTAVLRRIRTANTGRHFMPGRSLPAPRRTVPEICPSCDVRITDLGTCRCS